jgi:hypothetical protein
MALLLLHDHVDDALRHFVRNGGYLDGLVLLTLVLQILNP